MPTDCEDKKSQILAPSNQVVAQNTSCNAGIQVSDAINGLNYFLVEKKKSLRHLAENIVSFER